ncbi:hypothetical protein A2833_02575 [Candidatus Azambacteria bacterium RIFCSPHIGHO2_01_FULL_44_55]|uniref:Uncharacterized protein n=1 Tax=Candidatus Azambacteria bacterium RIFCSPLOWO2_02_FULL_44_14 TaxID=1797306 RepID=A0A1F5CD36_9BACT|nr:MAG: hypothetical protein A3A18_01250 [Candidatus Azambacteria bacterium RIFCSPLOWO2_01_FULL_44_84]OGD33333.1 MAG: hypothetical protein A3C78_02145 [Candidatus Azambacteria bacterium RIFCSPHIGHO2_02_FULL_45_18]OGD40658.1 MAG: hypothetical protein A2833_02575 [Candidatus Azambacteria bacterium RIFCSPHIGHO2_01_FULL_44_55]OGD40760.1 MAG: hypothetical protein A3I30_01655 [Candidatus Azambacteria bacterium RIFCSPLOWO2_02_FULL_44_14]OGD51197.1 MAG: hypothetical protein A2608_01640 [Candidatus Azam
MAIFSRIKNIGILTLAGVKFISSGRADKKIEMPKKILIVHLGKLGDMVCATPMFRVVKEKYPESKIYVAGNQTNQELLRGNHDVNAYLVYSWRFGKFLKIIKKEHFDFACVTTPDFLALAALYLADIPLISAPMVRNGFSPYETRPYKFLRHFVVTKPHHMGNYAAREYLRLLEPIGIFAEDTKKYLHFSEEAENKILNFFAERNINSHSDFVVGITPSAGNKIKEWPRDRFAKLADYIFEKYHAKIIVIGGPNDAEVDEMTDLMDRGTKFISARGIFNIEELKALISKLHLFISVDTGPIYIAEAFDVPTIDIIGPIDEKEQPPIGKLHKIVVAERQKPELYVMNARVYNEKEARRQTEAIGAQMVIDKFEELVKILKDEKRIPV